MSDLKDYAKLVRRMREAQTAYFETASQPVETIASKQAALKVAKAREDSVDRRTAAIIDGQLGLFR